MMVNERHYDDDALLILLSADDASSSHLSGCAECRERLEMFRMIADALRDESTWDNAPASEAPVPETIANLRSFADQMAIENEEATLLLPDLLDGPRETWMQNLHRHPSCRTAGVVRKLLDAVPAALDQMPRDAVELTALAVEIADHLEEARPQLRGAAWRERAYALFYTGDFAAAEKAVAVAERHFGGAVVNEYDLARVGILRASVEQSLEKYASAIEHARDSERRLGVFGDETKRASARLAEANLLFSVCRYEEAYSLLTDLKSTLLARGDLPTYARVLGNLGYCCWKMRRIDEALQSFDNSARSFEEIGNHSNAVRIRWNTARVLADEGRIDDALARLRAVSDEFERIGMMAAAIESSLEIAEVMVMRGSFDQVEEICERAMQRLQQARLEYTAPALTALALMQESARNRTATRQLVVHVREYLRRIPQEPNLLFAYPNE